jgi:hypothetical protein
MRLDIVVASKAMIGHLHSLPASLILERICITTCKNLFNLNRNNLGATIWLEQVRTTPSLHNTRQCLPVPLMRAMSACADAGGT